MNKVQDIYIIGDKKTSNPAKGIAASPLTGIGAIRNLDITTIPGAVRLGNLPQKQSGSVVVGQIVWQRKDPNSATNIWGVDDSNNIYLSPDSGTTWVLITGNSGTGTAQGLEIWKDYLIVATSTGLDAYGPLTGTNGAGTITSVGTAVTGSGTTFSTDVKVGDTILVGGQYRFVSVITDATHLTLNAAFSPDITGQAFTYFHWTKNFVTPMTSGLSESFRPMLRSVDGKCYVGNGKYVHSLAEATAPFAPGTGASYTLTTKAITLADGYEIRTIRELGVNLYLGTIFAQSNSIADIFPYSRSSLTLGLPLRIAEGGIRGMFVVGNRMYVIAGLRGKVFLTDTVSAVEIIQIPNYMCNLDAGLTFNIYPDAITYQKGQLLFGLGGSTIANCGVWGYNLDTKALTLQNTISTGNDGSSQAVYVSSILGNGIDSYTMAWRDVALSAYGVDKVNNALRYTSYAGYIESELLKVGKALENRTIQQIEINLQKPLVSGQGVQIKWRNNLTSSFTTLITADFATYGGYQSLNIPAASLTGLVYLQVRVELTTGASNLSPELDSVLLIPGE